MAKKHSFENAGKKMGFGVVNLAMQDGSYFRKALLCHTGTFDGLYGPITVTEQLLTCLADRYNKQRAKPKNDFDFAPILKDHERKVDNVLGRLMADLVVEDWIDPETCGVGKGLYGTLRIDDPAAKLKVEQGLYSQLSITFDEESFETFETSFVAVEAARGSQALSHDNGGNETMSIELQQKLTKLEKKHSGFKKKQSLAAKVRKAVSLEMKDAVGKTDEAITSLASQSKKAELALRTVMLTAQFRGFIREGKMDKAEFDAIKISELASQPKASLVALMDSYSKRKASSDIVQFGSVDPAATGVSKVKEMSAKEFRAAKEAQKQGKKSLSEGGAGAQGGGSSERTQAGDAPVSDVKMEDFDGALKALDAIGPMMDKLSEYKEKMSAAVKKLDDADGDSAEADDVDNEDDAE